MKETGMTVQKEGWQKPELEELSLDKKTGEKVPVWVESTASGTVS